MRTYRVHKGLIFIVLLVLLWGCSSIRVSQDYDLSGQFLSLETYAWQTDHQPQIGDIRVDNTLLDARIRSAVDRSLAEKGYRKVGGDVADFHVAYTYQIGSKIESDNVTFGFGFGGGGGGRYGGIGIDSAGRVREYDEGLLVIDLLDVSTGELLWRGNGTSRVDQHPKPEEAEKRIRQVVEKILAQFPPQAKK